MKKVFLVHGWSVKETTTYQALHLKLAEYGFELCDIYLGRYVSLDDDVQIRDISKALHKALIAEFGDVWSDKFHIITHSTGALVVKHWVVNHYVGKYAEKKALQNLVFLAGPHFGSRLAHHGRSMLAHMKYGGDTGTEILKSLELGSEFSWEITGQWFDKANWQKKGIRPFNLIGDRVDKELFASKIFPAGFEQGSDMVVRVAAGNLNCKRFEVKASAGKLKKVGAIDNIPFGALAAYTHSGDKHGIMNSIKKRSTLNNLNLRLIVDCLKVSSAAAYKAMETELKKVTGETRSKRQGFAQIDFRFKDQDGKPVNDYVIGLGAIKNGKDVPSKTVAHTHKNRITPNHFTVFINMKELEPELEYFIELTAKTHTELYQYEPESFRVKIAVQKITELICEDQTTQIDIILERDPDDNLFAFSKGTDTDLHVKWNRKGVVTNKYIKIK